MLISVATQHCVTQGFEKSQNPQLQNGGKDGIIQI